MTDAKRLVASDIDGTLLGPDKRISARTREAFQRLHAAGDTHIALVSSRMPASLAKIEAALGVPCWKIAYDGAIIAAPAGKALALKLELAVGIDINEVSTLLAPGQIAYVGAYAGDVWVCNARSSWSDREAFNTQVSPSIERDIPGAVKQHPLHKIMFRDNEKVIDALRNRLQEMPLRSGRWFSNGPTIVELVCRTASKAAGLDALVTRLQVAQDHVTVIGDGANDVAMFDRYADSVAVANAIPELKARARHHTARGDEDGVAQFLLSRLDSSSLL